MPANYTGDPNATQTPSGPPAAGSPPIGSLPVDSDPPNAATFLQGYKVVLDFIAWLLAPFANLSAWAQAIVRFHNAVGQTRFAVDHAGFPAGKFFAWQERWDSASVAGKSALGFGPWFGRWNYSIAGDSHGASIAINTADVGPPTFGGGPTGTNSSARTTNVYIASSPLATTDVSLLAEATGQVIIDAETSLTLQWDAQVGGTSVASEDTFGFNTSSLQNATGTTLSNAPFGAWFEILFNPSGPTHIICRWQGASGGIGNFNTFVVPGGTSHRYRIEYYGQNVSDDGTNQLLFFLDGTLVHRLAVNMTNAAPGGNTAVAAPFFRHDETPTGNICWLNAQVTDFRANTWPGDVLF